MPSNLEFNQTKKFRDYILSKNIQYPNGPQTFDENTYTVKNFNVLSNKDLGDVTNDREKNLNIIKQNNIFKPLEYLVTEEIKTIPIKNNLQLYPYFPTNTKHTLISILNTNNYDNESNLTKFSNQFIKNDPNGPIRARISQNLESNITGKIRIFDAIDGNISTASNILLGKEPLIEKNYKITVNNDLLGKGFDFIKTISGVELPFSEIKGDYFTNPNSTYRNIPNSELGRTLQDITGNLGQLIGIDRKQKINTKPSDLFLKYTGNGNKTLLFNNLSYSKYRPNYSTKAISQNTSKIFNFTDNLTQDIKTLLGNEAPMGYSYIGDDRDNDVKSVMTDYNDNYIKGPYALSFLYDPIQTKLFELDKNIEDGGNLSGNLTWISKNNKNKLGVNNNEYNREQSALVESLSTKYGFKESSILQKTQELLDSIPTDGGSAIGHVANVIDQTSRIFKDGNKLISKGSAIKYVDKFNEERGIEYCRVWTKDNPYSSYSDTMKRTGLIRKTDSSVLSTPWNLNIGPISDGNKGFGSSTNIGKKSNDDFYAKKYMFSIENLAWKSSDIQGYTYNDLPYCERGSNGGRIMWFPPYDLKFSEQNSAKWDENNFIGRPEPIYTYQNTTRSGTISFKIVVDHPSILNLLVREHFKDMSDEESTNYINAFFAGCENVDFYDLISRYSTLDVNDLNLVTSFLNNGNDLTKLDEKKLQQQPVVEIVNPSLTPINNSEEKIDFKFNLNFDDNVPVVNSDEITSSSSYTELYSNFINKKNNYKTRLNNELINLKNSNYNTEKLYIFNNLTPSNEDVNNQVNKLENYFSGLTLSFNEYNSNLLKLKLDLIENKVDNINIIINSSTSASGSEKFNNKLSLRRNHSILLDIFNKISNNKIPTIKWKKNNEINFNNNIEFSYSFSLKDFGYENNNGVLNIKIISVGETRKECLNKDFKHIPDLNITSPICFSCRESNLIIKYNKKLINSTNPNVSPISSIDSTIQNGSDLNTTINTENKKPPLDIMKKIIMKTLTESFYFKKIEESTPLFFNSLKEKLKYFHPSFHSTTPEGLNSRLTFLQQCLRPSNTIPIKGVTTNIRNTSFGPPPICILRIGDFYNSKIIIRDVNFSYEDSPLDINPEGIGVQPMIATVTLQVSFIGGQGMEKPVEMLQNALTSNFYANTEVYDDKSINTQTKINNEDVNVFTKRFLENTIQNTTANNVIKNNDDIIQGQYIGELFENTLNYKNLIVDVHNNLEIYYEKLKELYNNLDNKYGSILTNLLLSNDYRIINTFDVNYNSSNGIKSINLLGSYKKTKNLSIYKRGVLEQIMYVLNNNPITEILGINQNFNKNENLTIDLILTNPLKEIIENFLMDIDNIRLLSDFEGKIRKNLTNNLDKLNFIIKHNHDIVYKENKFFIVDLTGFNYDILYNAYTSCITYLENNEIIEEKLDKTINFDNIDFNVDNVRLILKSILKNYKKEINNIFQNNVLFYNGRNKIKIDNFFNNFYNKENEATFKLKSYPKVKNNNDFKFTIYSQIETNDNEIINESKLLFSSMKNNNQKLNNYK